MALPPEKIQERAIKAGIRASKRRRRRLSLEELLKLKIQILPDALRWALLIAGVLLIIGALAGWPLSQDEQQVGLGVSGGTLVGCAFLGIRRTLGFVFETFEGEGIGMLIEGILSAIGHLFGS